jgi:hypothetical protein
MASDNECFTLTDLFIGARAAVAHFKDDLNVDTYSECLARAKREFDSLISVARAEGAGQERQRIDGGILSETVLVGGERTVTILGSYLDPPASVLAPDKEKP